MCVCVCVCLCTADETYVEFSYRSTPKVADQRTGSRHTRVKAAPVEKNTDGTVKVRLSC